MDQYHRSHKKKVNRGSGAKKCKRRDKQRAHVGGSFSSTKVAESDSKAVIRGRGGKRRIRIKKAATVNVVGKDGKSKRVKIMKLVDSYNPEYVRMNIITKGAVLETELGKVRVTNRVGQDGIVNGVLV